MTNVIDVGKNGGKKVQPPNPIEVAAQEGQQLLPIQIPFLNRRQTIRDIAQEIAIPAIFVGIAVIIFGGAHHTPLAAYLIAGGLGVLAGKPTV